MTEKTLYECNICGKIFKSKEVIGYFIELVSNNLRTGTSPGGSKQEHACVGCVDKLSNILNTRRTAQADFKSY